MKIKQEIPSESRQQVISELKNTKENIILTSPIFEIPEAYMNAYKKQCDSSTIITLTEMGEVRTQIGIYDKIDLQIYIELSLAIDLCDQLSKKEMNNEELERMKMNLKGKLVNFLMGIDRNCRNTYYECRFLNPIFNYFWDEKYNWEWLIMNYDKPISDAKEMQEYMYQFMAQFKRELSRTILSAYDDCLKEKDNYHGFKVIHFLETINYEQIKQEVFMILHYLYPDLRRHIKIIERTLNSSELQQLYIENGYTPSVFIKGIQMFFEAYHCIDSVACFISFEEHLSVIQDYINKCSEENKMVELKKKKSKLYI